MMKLRKQIKLLGIDTFILLINKKLNLQARKTADGKGHLDVSQIQSQNICVTWP